MSRRYEVEVDVCVTVTVNDPDVIERVIGPNGDEWRSRFYASIRTAEDVMEHFAFNAVHNATTDIRCLDGWADVDEDAALVEVEAGGCYTVPRPG